MKVFLAGASGFIGSHVKRKLKEAGHHVISHSLSKDGILKGVPEQAEAVVNCAGRLGGQDAEDQELEEANLLLPVRLAESCSLRDIPLVHLSTPGVCGLVPEGRETDPLAPEGSYESFKAEAEVRLAGILPEVTILRPDFVFGPGDMHKFPMFRQVARGWFPLVGTGRARTRPTDVRDVADAVLQALPGGVLEGEIHNIGGPEVLSVAGVASAIARAMDRRLLRVPVPRVLYLLLLSLGPFRPGNLTRSRYRLFGSDRFTCIDKARSAGFEPRWSFRRTADDCVNWYRTKGLL